MVKEDLVIEDLVIEDLVNENGRPKGRPFGTEG
jgi:hypothetical protein